jgi:hypothetical protein
MAAVLYANAGDGPAAVAAVREAMAHAFDVRDRPNGITAASAAVYVVARRGAAEVAAVVAGFREVDPLAAHIFLFTFPGQREEELSTLVAARAALGDARYETARARGAAMSDDEAVQYALAEFDVTATPLP